MKKYPLLASTALFAALPLLANAQPRPVDLVVSTPQRLQTFGATALAVAPAAALTDFLTLTGSATKTVRVKSASCFASSTSTGSQLVVAVKRSTVDLAGTAATLTAAPHDSSNAAATAVAKSYTVNPTATGSLVANLASGLLNSGPLASGAPVAVSFGFGTQNDQEVVLHGTSEVFALNGNGATMVPGASLFCSLKWTEQ